MDAILNIDTSTTVCSVALMTENECLAVRSDFEGNNHSRVIGVFAKEILEDAKKNGWNVCAAALSVGPGSYTGLRIGASFVKGLCYGLDIPLVTIPTLEIMSWSVAQKLIVEGANADALLCPMIDARRMEVYSAIYDLNINEVEQTKANIIDSQSFEELLKEHTIYFFGNGSTKCKDTITHPNAKFIDGIVPLATNMQSMAWNAYRKQAFANVAYFEPFYLKDFIATKPNKLKSLGVQ